MFHAGLHRSTDSQLKLWNLSRPNAINTFTGHINEKNFVGLATDGDYVLCGELSCLCGELSSLCGELSVVSCLCGELSVLRVILYWL